MLLNKSLQAQSQALGEIPVSRWSGSGFVSAPHLELVWSGAVRVASVTEKQVLSPRLAVPHGAEQKELLFPQFMLAVIQV